MIVYVVLTGRGQDGEQWSGAKYTISGPAYEIYQKKKQTPKPIFFNIAKTVLQALGDKFLTRRISYDLMFLICENVL